MDRMEDHAFFIDGKPISSQKVDIFDRWFYWRAFRKFPGLSSCETGSVQGATNSDSKLKWKSMRTLAQIQVCMFHLSNSLDAPEMVAQRLQEEGFDVIYREQSGFGGQGISAIWNKNKHDSLSPLSLMSVWGLTLISPFVSSGVEIQLLFDENGVTLTETKVRFSTL